MFTRLCSGFALVGGLCLAGCGAEPGATGQPGRPRTNLDGNWLLAGALPIFSAPLSTGTRLAMTFSVDGTAVKGWGEYSVSCGSSGGGASISVQGTLMADGSFTAQTRQAASGLGASLSVRGRVPTRSGLPWTGSYTLDTTDAGTCQVQADDTFTAQPISSFTGTYTASGTYVDGTTETPVSVQMAVQQGVQVQDASGASTEDVALLEGTLSVSGVPCFSKGSTTNPVRMEPLPVREVSGGDIHPNFHMDDGSTLVFDADADNPSGQILRAYLVGVLGGNCATTKTRSLRITSLTKVN